MNAAEELFGVKSSKINSKRKGNANELTLSHLLTSWTGHEFVRVPMSGGLRWKNRMDICGDIINVEDKTFDFPYNIETKFYKNLGLKKSRPYLRTNSVVYKFMKQATDDAIAAKKRPILFIRENGMPKESYYVFLPYSVWLHVFLVDRMVIQYLGFNQDIIGVSSEDFFKLDYEEFKTVY